MSIVIVDPEDLAQSIAINVADLNPPTLDVEDAEEALAGIVRAVSTTVNLPERECLIRILKRYQRDRLTWELTAEEIKP